MSYEKSKVMCACGEVARYTTLRLCKKCYNRRHWKLIKSKWLKHNRKRAKVWWGDHRDEVLRERHERLQKDPEFRRKRSEQQFRAKYGGNGIRVLEASGYRCSVCGYDRMRQALDLHHTDNNRKNNEFSNLKVVCPTCHREIHLGARMELMGVA